MQRFKPVNGLYGWHLEPASERHQLEAALGASSRPEAEAASVHVRKRARTNCPAAEDHLHPLSTIKNPMRQRQER